MSQSFYYSVIIQFTQLIWRGWGLGRGQMQRGRMGMGKNTFGTVGDGDNWKLQGCRWGQLGVPMSLSTIKFVYLFNLY